nr:MarC family NAAT transporter [Klebsiella pneumoniae]
MFDLFKAIGLGLAVLLPLANPLTTVALFLGLAGNMNNAERNKQALMASVYVFAILMVSWYAGQVVMNTFGISIPGLRIAGGLIVAFIGFRMLFPQQKAHVRWKRRSNRKNCRMNRPPISPLCRWRCQAPPVRAPSR